MKQFSFMKFRWLYFLISGVAIIPGLLFLLLFGLKLSIDFTGGSLLELRYQQKDPAVSINREEFQKLIGEEPVIISVQPSGNNQVIIRMPELSNERKEEVIGTLRPQFAGVEELRFETVGPTLGKELFQKTLAAIFVVSVGIILYVGRQFKSVKYGVSAVLAMFHDSLVLIGMFAIFGKLFGAEVDVLFVTALLTTLSFSVHDTIVVFDRIRENRKKHPSAEFETVVDASVLETLGRSINNSMTIIIMLLALVLLGGDTIRWFGVALLIGAVTGTFSSTFTAAPLLLLWDDLQQRRKLRK